MDPPNSIPISLGARPAQPPPTRPVPTLRGFGFGFSDREVEREFFREQARERGRMMRVAIALLFVFSVAFGLVDYFVFAPVARTLLVGRAVMVTLLFLSGPFVFGKRSDHHLAAHGQEILLYQSVVGVGALLAMAWLTLGTFDVTLRMFALLTAMFALLLLYCASGLRASYAAIVGLGSSVCFVAMAYAHLGSTTEALVASAFLGGQNLIGLAVSFSLEQAARRAFVQRRTLEDARARTEGLLLNLVPAAFAETLKARPGDVIQRYPQASIVFATLVGFEEATAGLSPVEAVRMLDRIVSRFDRIAAAEGALRIKTVGATYMAAAGFPDAVDDDALAAARVALGLRDEVRAMASTEDLPLRLRTGIACGAIVAGVLGTRRIAFDCWGDTANLAARLDTHGQPDRVQISRELAERLGSRMKIEARGPVLLKGKGEIETAWLVDAEGT